jgi:hypothetical protein
MCLAAPILVVRRLVRSRVYQRWGPLRAGDAGRGFKLERRGGEISIRGERGGCKGGTV